MKTIDEIVKTVPVFTGEFADSNSADVMFCTECRHTNENVLYADYDCPPYEGYAYVVFEKDGKLYEVSGSHCSCYGLEDQWEPEEVCLPELANRVTNGKGTTDMYSAQVKSILGLD
jgi:hypothetical protein